MIDCVETKEGISFGVRIVPRASRNEIVGAHGGLLKVRIASAPVDGAANAELIRVMARHFNVARADVTIVSGETSKSKRIKIENLSKSDFEEKIR